LKGAQASRPRRGVFDTAIGFNRDLAELITSSEIFSFLFWNWLET
jgi:hypothetical protein